MSGEPLAIALPDGTRVSGLLDGEAGARAAFAFAHGAGAGMHHALMAAVAAGLARQGIAVLRYQFPAMERGSKRVDAPPVAHATVRAAVATLRARCPGLPLFAGGKSFGGRMTSQAQALAPLEGVRGLVFLGFPLHPAGKPSDERARHLDAVQVPMLFLQGTNDALAELALLRPVIARLGSRATLVAFDHADHAFHAPVKSGVKDAEILERAYAAISTFIAEAGVPSFQGSSTG